MLIYTYEIDTNTLEINQGSYKWNEEIPDNQPFDNEINTARYNEDGFEYVIAESTISDGHARQLVISKCQELCNKFINSEMKIIKEIRR